MKNAYTSLLNIMTAAIVWLMTSSVTVNAQTVITPFFKGVKTEVMIGRPSKIKGGDFDDKQQVLKPRVKLTNTDVRQNYEGHKACLMVLGESTIDSKVFKVLLKHEFTFSLPIRQFFDEEAPEVMTRYDTTVAKFGFKYSGWILVVKDAQGVLVQVKSTSPAIEKMPTQLDALKQDGCYNRQLKLVSEPVLTFR
jgi:hypothetical protein